MSEHLIRDIDAGSDVLRSFLGAEEPACAVVLGSGLGPYANTLLNARTLHYSNVPGMACSTCTDHVGQFVLGQIDDGQDGAAWVLCMQGRLHGYEGLSAQRVAFPVWLMHACGIDTLFTTNAAGGINPSFEVGDFCLITDHINLMGANPLAGIEPNHISNRFVAMNHAYDAQLQAVVRRAAREQGIPVREGVYIAVNGPSFETPAEIRAFALLGADIVAMSLIEEVIAARHVGMRVLGMSLVSNLAAGIQGAVPSDEEVLQIARTREHDFCLLANSVVRAVSEERRAF